MSSGRTVTILVFAVSSALYIWTMCPTVYTMDNGELIVAANNLQIAHPTGYPLFCLLGKLSTYVVPLGSIAARINAMNALLAAGAVTVLFLALGEVARRGAALFIAGLLAVSPMFWDVATSAEVHALTALLVSVELLLFLRWMKSRDRRLLLWLALVAGLAMANHLIAILVLPGLAYGALRHDRSLIRDRSLVAKCLVLFLLPLSIYLYLPLRAAASRGTIWGDIYTASGFLAHVTGHAFKTRMFTLPPEQVWRNLILFLRIVTEQFPIYIAWALPVGAILVRRRHRLLGGMLLVVAANVTYATNYAIPDIEPYYIPTMLVLSVFAAVGIESALARPLPGRARLFAGVAMVAVVLLAAVGGLPRADKHQARFIMDYADNVLDNVEQDALFIACGDSSYNAMLYARVVNGKRPDLIVIERNILRTWIPGAKEWTARRYYDQVSERSVALRAFRWPSGYSRQEIRSEKLLADIVAAAVRERPVYLSCTGSEYETHPVLKRLEGRCRLVPEGVVYRIAPQPADLDPGILARHSEHIWAGYELRGVYDDSIRSGVLERDICGRYAALHIALADLELTSGMYRYAARNFASALAIDPRLVRARNGLGVALACQGNYREAAKEWSTVLAFKPDDRTAIRNLQLTQPVLASQRVPRR